MNYFENHKLSDSTLKKLNDNKEFLKNEDPVDPAWYIIKPKENNVEYDKKDLNTEILTIKQDDTMICNNEEDTPPVVASTQFFFSQSHKNPDEIPVDNEIEGPSKCCDIAEVLCESLEKNNDSLCLVHLKTLSDFELNQVVKYLCEKLSLKGIYNLCNSLCAMDVKHSMSYIRIICSNLLLQKIINLKQPSRLISSSIHELLQKFPDDIQEFIFIPMLNIDLQETTVISTIISGFPIERKSCLIENFLTSVEELKEWHIVILSALINIKVVDDISKKKLINLLYQKASTYANDKNYSKFILAFIKLNPPFSDDQKRSISEIVAVNETIFKRAMENLLKNMYIYGDLWHIS